MTVTPIFGSIARSRPLINTTLLHCALFAGICQASPDLSEYLPADASYDESIPTPSSVLGFEVGEWHVRPDLLVRYMEVLAERSDRVQIEEYGRTHEARPLVLVTVSAPRNLERIEEIRSEHLSAALGAGGVSSKPASDRPVVVWMGYSVHGNEPSGANASLLLAYHLAAARGGAVAELLDHAVVLIDPAINPDGLGRFTEWANSHRGLNLVADPVHREHREAWPGGRTNHYWFDLNRDWLLLTHPESRGRLEKFHAWLPNIVTDFHEMGTDRTFFFQPGVPSRKNPRTPARNVELTHEIAKFHARILDAEGRLYYTQENFDDFYYGKGSTYPDVNGGIGILFEQASSRGHLQENSFGLLSFPFTIRNQFLTSLSTLEAAQSLRIELLEYQSEFYTSALKEAAREPVRAWVVGDGGDPARYAHFIDILLRHGIRVHRLAKALSLGEESYEPERASIIPLEQHQYRLLQALFERRTEFADKTFYDVSAWTLPLAFALPHSAVGLDTFGEDLLGEELTEAPFRAGEVHGESVYAYAFEWTGYYSPRAASRLLEAGLQLRVATRPFEAAIDGERRRFSEGTVLVPLGVQDRPAAEVRELLLTAAREDQIDIYSIGSGLTEAGIDLGSPNVLKLERPEPLLVVGSGVSSYEAGEVWHLLDQRYQLELTMVEGSSFREVDLGRYTHLVLVSGGNRDLPADDIREWVRAGGVLVSIRGAVPWTSRSILGASSEPNEPAVERTVRDASSEEPSEESPPIRELDYADYEAARAETLISGAILEARVDVTHPLAFGYRRETVPVFRNSTIVLERPSDPIVSVLTYTDTPLLSGYVSEANLERLKGTPVACAERLGRGVVIRLVDNPNFRGVWYGTNKLFANSLFFARTIRRTEPIESGG